MNLFKQLHKTLSIQLTVLLQAAIAMFLRFLTSIYCLGDSFLKSSKDFIN